MDNVVGAFPANRDTIGRGKPPSLLVITLETSLSVKGCVTLILFKYYFFRRILTYLTYVPLTNMLGPKRGCCTEDLSTFYSTRSFTYLITRDKAERMYKERVSMCV